MVRKPDFVDECYKNKDLSLLKKLTLVIPTYNRNFYLSRCLWYHAHFPFGQIIVADSSSEEKKTVNRDTVTKITKMFGINVLYIEYKPETDIYGGDIYKKWGDAIQHAKTEYSQFCTDKEFIIPTVCCESITFLMKNPDYINAFGWRGDCITSLSSNKVVPTFPISSYIQNTVSSRFSTYLEEQTPFENIFQIYRTSNHKILFQNLSIYQIENLKYGELTLELEPIFMGKLSKISSLGRIRDLTMLYRSSTINVAESSAARYISIRNHPMKLRESLLKKMEICLCSLLPDSEKIDSAILNINVLNSIVDWWGSPVNQKKNTILQRLNRFWGVFPDKVKRVLSRLLSSTKLYQINYYKRPVVPTKNKTIKVILEIISSKSNDASLDLVISYLRF